MGGKPMQNKMMQYLDEAFTRQVLHSVIQALIRHSRRPQDHPSIFNTGSKLG